MNLPKLPEPAAHLADSSPLYSESQVLKLQADTIEAVLKVAYEQATAYGKTGECIWVGIKATVRYAQKGGKNES